MTEVWKPIPDYPGYEASDAGRVRSFKKQQCNGWVIADLPQRILKIQSQKGYQFVLLCCDGIRYNRRVHILVLGAFVGPKPEGMVSCHKDCNPSNNQLSNLRYDTQSNNLRDGVGDRATKCLTNKKAVEVKHLAAQGFSDEELAGRFDISADTVARCRLGRSYSYTQGPITNHVHKLADSEVRQMREMARDKGVSISVTQLAEMFNTTISHVSLLLRGLRRKKAGGPILPPRYGGAKSEWVR